MLLQIASNAVTAKLINPDKRAKELVSALLTYSVEGAEHAQSFKAGHWDGCSSLFEYGPATFPAGFQIVARNELAKHGYEVQFVRKPLPAPLGPAYPAVDSFGTDNPRYAYQYETIEEKLLKYGQMIAQVATGGGKSRIAKIAVARIRRTTLFLTTRSVLMYQMADHFRKAGWEPGILGDGEFAPRRGVNVGMVQTLAARLADPSPEDPPEKQRAQWAIQEQTQKLLQIFEFVILEEAHEAGGNSFYQIMRHCKNAHYRLSLTATPFMRPDGESNMRLMACSGPVGIRISEKMLIDKGILATPYFKYIDLPPAPKVFRSTSWQRAYKFGITFNEARNAAAMFEAKRIAAITGSSLMLVQRKEHGQLLEEKLRASGTPAKFIFGESSERERRGCLQALGRGIDVLIGSTILDVGVDVPALGGVILAGGGKAEVGLRQRVGRGLREKKGGPNVAFMVDFNDGINHHLAGHALTRRQIIEGTEGFAEGILPAGADFDFTGLGFSAAA